ncbi:hypothetical protein LJB88_02140 [Erysipelotrichaceae bacterium OttesenSCG-928-M19]|nr:hypothetical protein [Erysipelotrichaceae bacterium OttesenSCG-928-M19]
MSIKLDKYNHSYINWGKRVLKNKMIIPALESKMTLPHYVSYKGNRLTLRAKSQNIQRSPKDNARTVMRNAKTIKQKRYARYLFSQLGK